jgi:hypothetical protein
MAFVDEQLSVIVLLPIHVEPVEVGSPYTAFAVPEVQLTQLSFIEV